MSPQSRSVCYTTGSTQIAAVNRRSRRATFERRKKGLLKKASEFSTLCEVDTCVIIFPPPESSEPVQTWPSDPEQVTDIIRRYYDNTHKKLRKNYDLREFFNDKKNQAEAETSRLRQERLKNKETTDNPTWDHNNFDNLSHDELNMFINELDSKIQECDQRIDHLKKQRTTEESVNSSSFDSFLFENCTDESISEAMDSFYRCGFPGFDDFGFGSEWQMETMTSFAQSNHHQSLF